MESDVEAGKNLGKVPSERNFFQGIEKDAGSRKILWKTLEKPWKGSEGQEFSSGNGERFRNKEPPGFGIGCISPPTPKSIPIPTFYRMRIPGGILSVPVALGSSQAPFFPSQHPPELGGIHGIPISSPEYSNISFLGIKKPRSLCQIWHRSQISFPRKSREHPWNIPEVIPKILQIPAIPKNLWEKSRDLLLFQKLPIHPSP